MEGAMTWKAPEVLAVWLGLLGVDFDLEHPERDGELLEHLRDTAERYQRVVAAPQA
jgi:hypothetical protein